MGCRPESQGLGDSRILNESLQVGIDVCVCKLGMLSVIVFLLQFLFVGSGWVTGVCACIGAHVEARGSLLLPAIWLWEVNSH